MADMSIVNTAMASLWTATTPPVAGMATPYTTVTGRPTTMAILTGIFGSWGREARHHYQRGHHRHHWF